MRTRQALEFPPRADDDARGDVGGALLFASRSAHHDHRPRQARYHPLERCLSPYGLRRCVRSVGGWGGAVDGDRSDSHAWRPRVGARPPPAAELGEALTAPALIGVQTRRDFEALQRFCPSRRGGTVVSPASIDPVELTALAESRAPRALIERLRTPLGSRLLVVGVDRIDYTKWIQQRIDAIDRASRQGSVSPDDVEFVQIAEPSRMGLAAYRELRLEVERRAHDVASNWLRSDGTSAMRLVTEPCDRRYAAAILSAADVALVTGRCVAARRWQRSRVDRRRNCPSGRAGRICETRHGSTSSGRGTVVDVAAPGVRFRMATRRCRVFGPTAARRETGSPSRRVESSTTSATSLGQMELMALRWWSKVRVVATDRTETDQSVGGSHHARPRAPSVVFAPDTRRRADSIAFSLPARRPWSRRYWRRRSGTSTGCRRIVSGQRSTRTALGWGFASPGVRRPSGGYRACMSNQPSTPSNETDSSPRAAGSAEAGQDSTVTDWHGQEVDRDIEAADDALALAGGDEAAAEEIFDDIRPEHPSDRFKVPADQRPGTLD